jgi:hypothetical protein
MIFSHVLYQLSYLGVARLFEVPAKLGITNVSRERRVSRLQGADLAGSAGRRKHRSHIASTPRTFEATMPPISPKSQPSVDYEAACDAPLLPSRAAPSCR